MQYLDLHEIKRHGTDIFPFEYYYVTPEHSHYIMNYHWHAEYELIRVRKGTLHVTLNEKSFDAAEGDLVFIHGGILHAGMPSDCVYECIVFDLNVFLRTSPSCDNYIQRILDRSALVYHHFIAGPEYGDIHNLIDIVFGAMNKHEEGFEMQVIGGLYMFFSAVFSKHYYLDTLPKISQKDVRKTIQLRKVIDYMDSHIEDPVTLADLAGAASMSPKYFCRFFYQMTHHSPIEYLNMQRIEYACYALSTTDDPITVIAMNCGFNDLSYFIKMFKRYKGTTPGQYRN